MNTYHPPPKISIKMHGATTPAANIATNSVK